MDTSTHQKRKLRPSTRVMIMVAVFGFIGAGAMLAAIVTQNTQQRIWRATLDSGDDVRPVAPGVGLRLIPNVGEPVCSDALLTNAQHSLRVGLFFIDLCPGFPDADDDDGDGVPDGCDICADSDDNVDTDGDAVPDGCDNCPNASNAFQSEIDGDGVGDLCDICPADPVDGCNPQGSTANEFPAGDGGIVATPNGALMIVIGPGDLQADTTISITENVNSDPEVDLRVGINPGLGQVIAMYDLEPDGLAFNNPVMLTVVADVTALNANQQDSLNIYIFTDTDGDGVPDQFVAVPGTMCIIAAGPPAIATCIAAVDHFSEYAFLAPLDTDDDGVPDLFPPEQDNCPAVPSADQADADGDGVGDPCDADCPALADPGGDFIFQLDDLTLFFTCFLNFCPDWPRADGPLTAARVSAEGTWALRSDVGKVAYCCGNGPPPLNLHGPGECVGDAAVAGSRAIEFSGANLARREIRRGGTSIDVHLRIRPPADSNAYALEETVPPGLRARAVSHGGMYSPTHGAIRWGPFLDNAPRDLTYELVAPDEEALIGSFDGVVSFDGHDTWIQGQSEIATLRGDADHDGDVDLADYLQMVECFSHAADFIFAGCEVFDFDDDRDVDLADLVAFQAAFSAAK